MVKSRIVQIKEVARGVVDQKIDRAKHLDRAGDESVDLFCLHNVTVAIFCRAAFGADACSDCFAVFVIDVTYHHAHAVLRQRLGNSLANAAAGAGHDSGLAADTQIVFHRINPPVLPVYCSQDTMTGSSLPAKFLHPCHTARCGPAE